MKTSDLVLGRAECVDTVQVQLSRDSAAVALHLRSACEFSALGDYKMALREAQKALMALDAFIALLRRKG